MGLNKDEISYLDRVVKAICTSNAELTAAILANEKRHIEEAKQLRAEIDGLRVNLNEMSQRKFPEWFRVIFRRKSKMDFSFIQKRFPIAGEVKA